MKKTLLVALTLLMVATAACRDDKEFGSKVPKVPDGPGGKAGIEDVPDPTGAPTQPAPRAVTPKATAAASVSPKAEEKFFDVTLVDQSPYYEPGRSLTMPAGFTLRVTNKDSTGERPVRSFEAKNGSFSSGALKPGQVWTQKFDTPGFWEIQDMAAPFFLADLTVN